LDIHEVREIRRKDTGESAVMPGLCIEIIVAGLQHEKTCEKTKTS